MTILEFAQKVVELTGSRSRRLALQGAARRRSQRCRQPDITKARRILGWEPKVGLDEGLERTFAYFRNKIEEEQKASAGA